MQTPQSTVKRITGYSLNRSHLLVNGRKRRNKVSSVCSWTTRASLFVMAIYATAIAASDRGPGQYVEKSPSGRYNIVQRYTEPKDAQDNQDLGAWEAVLHFADRSKPDATLATDSDRYLWPADYLISPDEQWILRLQKTGSGENSALLYHVNANGQVWRLEQRLDELAFAVATVGSHLSRSDYYHISVALVSWDIAAGLVHLKIFATPEDRANSPIDRKVVYDLRKHRMVAE